MKYTRFFTPLTFVLALAACQPTMANRGNLVDDDRLAQVRRELGPELHAELVQANAEDLVLFEKVAALYGLAASLAEAS